MNAKEQKLMDWLARSETGVLLESQVVSSGLNAALNSLLMAGKVTMMEHPTVRERSGIPAAAVALKADQ
jgi:hypothetical protein